MYWKKDKDKKELSNKLLKQPPTARTERRSLLWEWKEPSVWNIYIEKESNLEVYFMEFIFLTFFFFKIFKKFGFKIIHLRDTKLVGQAISVVFDKLCRQLHWKHTHTPVNQHHVWFFSSSHGGGGVAVCPFFGIECFQFSTLVFCHVCWHVRNDISQSVASD
jgi:hypothetical protein